MKWENEVDEPVDKLANKLSREITTANTVYNQPDRVVPARQVIPVRTGTGGQAGWRVAWFCAYSENPPRFLRGRPDFPKVRFSFAILVV